MRNLGASQRTYLEEVTRRVSKALGQRACGVYLMGSAALGDFASHRSDLDVQAVSDTVLPRAAREHLAADLRHDVLPCPARGLEFVLYARGDLRDPSGPAFLLNLNTGRALPPRVSYDPDDDPRFWFTVDVSIGRQHGVALQGPPAASVFPELPTRLVADALADALDWYESRGGSPAQAVLAACRTWAWASDRRWRSKADSAEWARGRLEDPTPVEAALRSRDDPDAAPPPAEAAAVLIGRARAALRKVRGCRRCSMTTDQQAFALAEPGTPEYADAIATYNLDVRLRPRFAVTVRDADEARQAIAEARMRGLGVRILATGHLSDACAPLGDEVVVRVAFAEPVRIDVGARSATVHAGTLWGEVAQAAAPHGLVGVHGTSPTVGAIGYLLGGGISVYGRRFGLAANSIRSVELLTADGVLRTVDTESDPELLDAIRGGGGGFGLVASATVELHPVTHVMTGAIFWPIAVAQEILAGWCDWARDAPRTASTSFRTIRFPPDAPVPPALTAGPVVCIDGVVIDEPGQRAQDVAGGLLDPLRRIAAPLVDTWRLGGPLDVTSTHMDPLDPLPYEGEHLLLGELDRAGQDAWLSVAATDAGADLAFVELRQLGGAIAEGGADGGVLDRLDGAHALYVLGVLTGDAERDARVTQQLALARRTLSPWDTGYTAPTFAAGWTEHQRSFDAATARRVQAVRDRVDPEGVFAGNVVRGARVR